MRLGESIEIATGVALGVRWRAEIHQYKNGPHPRVLVHMDESEWRDMSDMCDELDGEDMAIIGDEIACALVAELAKAKRIEVKS